MRAQSAEVKGTLTGDWEEDWGERRTLIDTARRAHEAKGHDGEPEAPVEDFLGVIEVAQLEDVDGFFHAAGHGGWLVARRLVLPRGSCGGDGKVVMESWVVGWS